MDVVCFEFVHDEEKRDHADRHEDTDDGAAARRLPVQIRLLGVVGGGEAASGQGVENRRAAETNVTKRAHENGRDEVTPQLLRDDLSKRLNQLSVNQ